MPEMLTKANGDTDWTKFFMAMAAGAVVVMQSYSQLQHNQTREDLKDMHQEYLPATTIQADMKVNRANLKLILKDVNHRLNRLEDTLFKAGESMEEVYHDGNTSVSQSQ